MTKEITLTVRRGVVGYDVAVSAEGTEHAGGANRSVTLVDVVPTARALLAWIFRKGDTIVYCNLAFHDIDETLRALEMARRGWT